MSRFIRQTLIRPDALAISVDLSRITTPRSLIQRMQEAFELPAYFSGGLDSLNDCMRDLGAATRNPHRLLRTGRPQTTPAPTVCRYCRLPGAIPRLLARQPAGA